MMVHRAQNLGLIILLWQYLGLLVFRTHQSSEAVGPVAWSVSPGQGVSPQAVRKRK